jgi:mercury(II) reductase
MIRLKLKGMTCEGCARTVARALEGVPGVRGVVVRYEDELAEVEGAAGLQSLIAALRGAGYDAEPLSGQGEGKAPVTSAAADLVIVGSGSAGVAAALEAAGRGARVRVVEAGTLGGTCVNVGCVPSKTLLRAAEAARAAMRPAFPGVLTAGARVDFGAVARARDGLVTGLRSRKYAEVLAAAGVELVEGTARFASPDTLLVNGEPLAAGAYVIATGAEPVLPRLPGIESAPVWTYREATTATQVPERLVVVGGGPVGLELAQAFARLGSRVVVLEAQARILPTEEEELATRLAGYLQEDGVRVETGVTDLRFEGSRVHSSAGAFEADRVLLAVGRRPRTRELGLEAAGVEHDDAGFVRVDESLQTTNPRVWAAGDVAALPQFVYVAAHSGRVAARNALGEREPLDLTAVPRVVFTDPALAVVGLGEYEARARFGEGVRTATLELTELPRALVAFDTRGLFKIVVDASGRILGLAVLAPGAGDVMGEAALAVRLGLDYRELVATHHPYLTLAEGLRLVAQALEGDVRRLSCCA